MQGEVVSYLPEKQYGFIKGDDGKDYFFHCKNFKDIQEILKLGEGSRVEFEQKATPKGYSAAQVHLVDANAPVYYQVPDTVYVSKDEKIKGWEVVDLSCWVVHGSSRHSPDDAKDEMLKGARAIGANALLRVAYHKTTGSESGTGKGTYYYTIHHFQGQAANIGKKNVKGSHEAEALRGINVRAKALKLHLMKKTKSAKKKRAIFWFVVLVGVMGLWIFKENIAIFGTVVLLFGAFFLSHATDYDEWLKEAV
ncbi:cold shock domain-containing protein [Sulfurospirillum sp. T05]|uniref:Cold shock domain-containing protein n=1 Tax=Sulfurospirillum tamanense TaxID=2813362 RepID=A0ABS2WTK1_9BACT|nr:cold shock domain-containing protein [Sulfurospirillum tamanensis]MBN2964992.1 cold shock domain-containing protein [Sulfurospirillum tamanensis]